MKRKKGRFWIWTGLIVLIGLGTGWYYYGHKKTSVSVQNSEININEKSQLRVVNKDGVFMLKMIGADTKFSTTSKDGKTTEFQNVRTDTDLIYTQEKNKVVQTIKIKGKGAEASYSFILNQTDQKIVSIPNNVKITTDGSAWWQSDAGSVAVTNHPDGTTEMIIKIDPKLIYGKDAKFPLLVKLEMELK